jgi:hypothetical protein
MGFALLSILIVSTWCRIFPAKSCLISWVHYRELVLQANNPQALVKMIKWASTLVNQVSAPASLRIGDQPVVIDMDSIPVISDDADVW